MKIAKLIQGTEEWKKHRTFHLNGSEAAIMLGIHPSISRDQLLFEKSTGIVREYDSWVVDNIFADGHEIESKLRSKVAALIGEDLYQPTVYDEIDGLPLSSSLDGATADYAILWECKTENAAIREAASVGQIPEYIRAQMEQALLITGAEKCFFSAGSMENDGPSVVLEYLPDPALRARITMGWKVFLKDLSVYVPVAAQEKLTATPVPALPAIAYRLNGLALSSNLDEYKQAAVSLVERSKAELITDQDFADAELRIKSFEDAESKIDLVIEQVIGEFTDVAKFQRDLGDIKELIRQARLNSSKQVKSRKDQIRIDIQQAAQAEFSAYVSALNNRIGKAYMPTIHADFGGAMKGKKTIDSLKSAVNDEMARAKIEAERVASVIETNMATLREKASAHTFLFADVREIVLKDVEFVAAIVDRRIREHKEFEARREADLLARQEEDRQKAKALAEKQESERIANEEAQAARNAAAEHAAKVVEERRHAEIAARAAETAAIVAAPEPVVGMTLKDVHDQMIAAIIESGITKKKAAEVIALIADGKVPFITMNVPPRLR